MQTEVLTTTTCPNCGASVKVRRNSGQCDYCRSHILLNSATGQALTFAEVAASTERIAAELQVQRLEQQLRAEQQALAETEKRIEKKEREVAERNLDARQVAASHAKRYRMISVIVGLLAASLVGAALPNLNSGLLTITVWIVVGVLCYRWLVRRYGHPLVLQVPPELLQKFEQQQAEITQLQAKVAEAKRALG